jgi:hypothetical protein
MEVFGRRARLAILPKPPTNLRILEVHSLQFVVLVGILSAAVRLRARAIGDDASLPLQPLNAPYGTVDYAGELVPIFFPASLPQALPGFLNRKPGAISVGLFRQAEP